MENSIIKAPAVESCWLGVLDWASGSGVWRRFITITRSLKRAEYSLLDKALADFQVLKGSDIATSG